jgi:hypothetical protein
MAQVIVCGQSVFEAKATPSLPPITLTIVGPSGNQVVLHETDIGNLPSYTAYGGMVTRFPALKSPGFYTGVPITTLVGTLGEINSGNNVTVIASDNYSVTFTYDQLNGNLQTYDSTLNPVPHSQSLTVMLAYYYNGSASNLGSNGPLEVAIVGPEGLYTSASLWNHNVVELDIEGPMLTSALGGEWAPTTLQVLKVNTLQLLAPWIILACLVLVAAASIVYVKLRKKP